jgi:hypothetical protein
VFFGELWAEVLYYWVNRPYSELTGLTRNSHLLRKTSLFKNWTERLINDGFSKGLTRSLDTVVVDWDKVVMSRMFISSSAKYAFYVVLTFGMLCFFVARKLQAHIAMSIKEITLKSLGTVVITCCSASECGSWYLLFSTVVYREYTWTRHFDIYKLWLFSTFRNGKGCEINIDNFMYPITP